MTFEISNEELVSQAQAGDTSSFESLVDRHKMKAVQIAYTYTRNFEDARDIAQEAFFKAYQSLDKFRAQAKFSTWLFRIVIHCSYDFLRKRRETTVSDESIFELSAPEATQSGIDSVLVQQWLNQLLSELPEQQKHVLVLHFYHGFTLAETAQTLEVSEGTVKATKFQTIQKLKQLIKSEKEKIR